MSRSDPVSVEIFASLFQSVVDEMAWIVLRSAHTTFVKETQDFSTALLTPEGEAFAAPVEFGATPLLGIHMGTILGAFDDWRPGDVVFTNDPYSTGGAVMQLNDGYVVKPVFDGGRLLCFVWAFIHFTDVGGAVPGSIDMVSEQIFAEGIRVRPVKLVDAGRPDNRIRNLILDNSRIPALNDGDLDALLSALDTGERRVLELVGRRGAEAFERAMYDTLDRTEHSTRAVLRTIPPGEYGFVEYFEDDYVSEVPVRLQTRLTSRGDGTVELDFHGSDPEVAAAINLPTGSRRHHPFLCLALVNFVVTHAEGLHANAGILRCLDLVLPERSVVNAGLPAACGMRFATAMRIHELVLGALNQAVPGRVPAGGSSALVVTYIATADRVVVANPVQGGSGGGPRLNGVSGADFPANFLRSVPAEILESEIPVLVRRFALRPDTEGAGRYRGGFGVEYALEVLDPAAVVVMRGKDRHRFAAWGVHGGGAGGTGGNDVLAADGTRTDIGKVTVFRPAPGEICVVAAGGGGGFGDPLGRPPEDVLADVLDGLVSAGRARDAYGVVVEHGVVQPDATRALRERLRADRPETSVFDLGPGRDAWEHRWRVVGEHLTEVLPELPPRLRRHAQRAVYRALAGSWPDTAGPVTRDNAEATWKQVCTSLGITV
jgi:N-methylhydantoinase B